MWEADLRVLHVGKFYPPARGGMERVLQLLAEGERGRVDTRVLAASSGPRTVEETYRGVPVTRVARFGAVGTVLLLVGVATGAEPVLIGSGAAGTLSLTSALVWRSQLIDAWRREHPHR